MAKLADRFWLWLLSVTLPLLSAQNVTSEVEIWSNVTATAQIWSTVTLNCPLEGQDVIWVTPSDLIVTSEGVRQAGHQCENVTSSRDQKLFLNGSSLTVIDLGWSDRGRYRCFNEDNVGHVTLTIDPEYRKNTYYISLIVAASTAGGLLLLTLLCKLFHYLIHT